MSLKGCAVHVLPSLVFVAIAHAFHFSLFGIAFAFLLLSGLIVSAVLTCERIAPAVQLPPWTWRDFASGLTKMVLRDAMGGAAVVCLSWRFVRWCIHDPPLHDSYLRGLLLILTADFSYYCYHRYLGHHSLSACSPFCLRWMTRQHRSHHEIAQLDFLRGQDGDFSDNAIFGYQLPAGALGACSALSLEATLTAYIVMCFLQVTHHANHPFEIGLLRYILMDNRSHQFHHCNGKFRYCNFGGNLSIFDRLLGSFFDDAGLKPAEMHARLRVQKE